MTTSIDIGLATLDRSRPDLVVVRFKPGAVADPISFQVSIEARKRHFADAPHAVLLVAPDEVDFHPDMLNKDHYKDTGADSITLALAVVSTDDTFTRILELYYALHPAPFPVKLFAQEKDALRWVEERLAEQKSVTGRRSDITHSTTDLVPGFPAQGIVRGALVHASDIPSNRATA